MRVRIALALALALALSLLGGGMAAVSATTGSTGPVIVTMIDTGVRASHQEFNYGGSTSTTDQFVGWWDFSTGALPTFGQTWDATPADPFDPHGHGTATASSAVGLNVDATKYKSAAPGFKLAVAKVGDAGGAITGDLAAAVRWARESVKTDIISMSIGAIVPFPAAFDRDFYNEVRLARLAGILVVVSNGNGWANFGLLPGEPGATVPYGNSPDLLGVGASDLQGALVTTDPEVAAAYTQRLACRSSNTCYANISGTSFSAPYTAGFAARLMQTNRDNGFPGDPGYIETLVKYAARDTVLPPTTEGYGVVDAAQLAAANAHAAAGTLPARPTPDSNALYVDTVQRTADQAWVEYLGGPRASNLVRTNTGTGNAFGTIGTSSPSVSEAESYDVTVTGGTLVTADLTYAVPDAVNDVDVWVFYNATGSTFNGTQLVAYSATGAGVPEHVEFAAPATGTYQIVVTGYSIATPQAVTLTSSATLTPSFQDYVVHNYTFAL